MFTLMATHQKVEQTVKNLSTFVHMITSSMLGLTTTFIDPSPRVCVGVSVLKVSGVWCPLRMSELASLTAPHIWSKTADSGSIS